MSIPKNGIWYVSHEKGTLTVIACTSDEARELAVKYLGHNNISMPLLSTDYPLQTYRTVVYPSKTYRGIAFYDLVKNNTNESTVHCRYMMLSPGGPPHWTITARDVDWCRLPARVLGRRSEIAFIDFAVVGVPDEISSQKSTSADLKCDKVAPTPPTQELIAEGDRWLALQGWRWMSGMLAVFLDGRTERYESGDGAWAYGDRVPDITDPATRGCLLALAREITECPTLHADPAEMPDGLWWFPVGHTGPDLADQQPTETLALLAACEEHERENSTN